MAKYVIVEESWEYNDEYYCSPDGGAYHITSKLYSEENLSEAKAEVDKLNEKAKENKWFRTEGWDDSDGDENGSFIRPFKIVKIEE
jgi:hypothetical protein